MNVLYPAAPIRSLDQKTTEGVTRQLQAGNVQTEEIKTGDKRRHQLVQNYQSLAWTITKNQTLLELHSVLLVHLPSHPQILLPTLPLALPLRR